MIVTYVTLYLVVFRNMQQCVVLSRSWRDKQMKCLNHSDIRLHTCNMFLWCHSQVLTIACYFVVLLQYSSVMICCRGESRDVSLFLLNLLSRFWFFLTLDIFFPRQPLKKRGRSYGPVVLVISLYHPHSNSVGPFVSSQCDNSWNVWDNLIIMNFLWKDKIWLKAWMMSKLAALWCTAARG